MSVWKSDETLLSICILNFSFKNDFVSEEISNIRHSVSSPDETLYLMFDILHEDYIRRDPFNQHSDRSDREKRTTSKGGPVFSKLFRLDRTDPLSFGPKFPESLIEWIAPYFSTFLFVITS